MKNLLKMSLILVVIISMSSCAKWRNKVASDGQWVGSKDGDWVVVKQSGGVITDVWLLEDQMVQSESGSDGWLFKDKHENPIHVGGDMKANRVNNNKDEIFGMYIEYHMEFDSLTYYQRLMASKH
jgi:hypothetical protein